MPLYRKKVFVEAVQWFPGTSIEGVEEFISNEDKMPVMGRIKTIEDYKQSFHFVVPGSYICIGVKGEKWAVDKEIFESTYELVK